MARVLFEKNDIPNACAANANALAQADASQVELRNQIQYQGQRCPVAVATVNSPMTDASANNPKTPATASTTPKSASPNTTSTTPVTPTPVVATEKEKPRAVDTTTPPVATPSTVPRTVVPTQRPKPPTEANDSKPSIVDPAKAPKAAAEKAVTKASTTPSRGNGYSVQVAAYTNRAEADKLTSTLRKRGYATRVDGSVAPFRVRVGRYATEKEAEDALRKIKANHMDGFVVRAPER
jgi:cell division protein FtsN